MPLNFAWISVSPFASGWGTVSVAVWEASSSVTLAVWAAAPLPIVTSRNSISNAFSTTLAVGSATCTRMVSVPSNRSRARSTTNARS